MVRKETAPFDNPWLSAIDSTEKKLARYASFNPLYPAPERSRSVWPESRSLHRRPETRPSRANDCMAVAPLLPQADAPPEEAYQQLLPTLARINQRLRATKAALPQAGCQDESVEVALRVVRKQRAGRLKQ